MSETISVCRAILQEALDSLEHHKAQTRPIGRTQNAIATLRAALDAPQADDADPMGDYADANRPIYAEKFGEPDATSTVDCRGCAHRNYIKGYCMTTVQCVDFDKFHPLPPIVLTKVTK